VPAASSITRPSARSAPSSSAGSLHSNQRQNARNHHPYTAPIVQPSLIPAYTRLAVVVICIALMLDPLAGGVTTPG